MKKYLFALLVLLLPVSAFSQAKIYTRKAKLADLPVCKTKVVLPEDQDLSSRMREDVISVWRVSAYEFCTLEEYEALKSDNSLYFLCPEKEEGTDVLVFSKGGLQKSDDSSLETFEIVRIPVGDDFSYISSLLNIVQTFVEDAMGSDRVGYAGLRYYNSGRGSMRRLARRDPSRLVHITSGRYSLVFDRDTDELYSFRRH